MGQIKNIKLHIVTDIKKKKTECVFGNEWTLPKIKGKLTNNGARMDQQRSVLLVLLVFVCLTSGAATEELKENEDIEQNNESPNEKISDPTVDKLEKLNPEEPTKVKEDSKTEKGGEVLSEKQSTLSDWDGES